MRQPALRGRARLTIAWIHRWTGLAMLAFIVAAAATGSVLAFRDEVDRWLNPELFVVTPRGNAASLDAIFALVEATYPDVIASSVTFPTRPDESFSVFLRARQARTRQRGEVDTLGFNTVFVDQYQLRVLGRRSSLGDSWTRAEAIPILLRFHYTLLLRRPGLWVMGTCAALWLATNLIGLALAWPRAWRRVRGWQSAVTVRRRGGAYVVNCDLHRSIGVVLLPALTVLAFTSVYLSFPIGTRAAIASIAPVTPGPSGRRFEGVPPITPADALRRAQEAVPGGRPNSLFRESGSGWYSIRLQLPTDVAPYGNSQVYVAYDTGAILAQRSAATAAAGDVVLNWLRPLHTGAAFGLAGRIALALTGLAIVVLGSTALYTWLQRRPAHGGLDQARESTRGAVARS